MHTLQINKVTRVVEAMVSPPTATPPIDTRYHLDVDLSKIEAGCGYVHDPVLNTFSKPVVPNVGSVS